VQKVVEKWIENRCAGYLCAFKGNLSRPMFWAQVTAAGLSKINLTRYTWRCSMCNPTKWITDRIRQCDVHNGTWYVLLRFPGRRTTV